MSGCISGTWVRLPRLLHASLATDSILHPSISLLSRTDAPIYLASSSFSACPVGRPTSRSFYLVASPFFLFFHFYLVLFRFQPVLAGLFQSIFAKVDFFPPILAFVTFIPVSAAPTRRLVRIVDVPIFS